MKGKLGGIVQLRLSIRILWLVNSFFFDVLGMLGISLSGNAYEIANFGKYALITLIIFVIYHGNIKAGKNKFDKSLLNSVIYSVACFVFLIVITIGLHELLKFIDHPVSYNFTNYFDNHFNLSFALNFIIETIFMPFLLCVIFPLGFSNVIKKNGTATLLSGLTYGILYGISLNTSFEVALFASITPAIVIALLTYLYKTNQNIWSVIITYISYVLFGIFAINYIL